jgi:hypothetical protein
VLAGSHLPPAEVEQVRNGVREVLRVEIAKKGVGEKVRNRPLTAALLADPRIADATVTLTAQGEAGMPATPGADFQPAPEASLRLDPADVAFAAETFDQAAPASGQPIPVEVRAVVGVQLAAGTSAEQARTLLTAKLQAFFAQLTPGATVDTAALLTTLRDDARYAIDPLRLVVTLTAAEQFAQIAQGGPVFQVLPRHAFTVADLELEVAP